MNKNKILIHSEKDGTEDLLQQQLPLLLELLELYTASHTAEEVKLRM